jgi:hypothetical protein
MNNQEIISDITSRDTHKVWRSSCEIIMIGQDSEKIKELIPYLDLIKEKTKGLDMGGGFAPNQRFVDFAIRTIEFHKSPNVCSCNLYLEHSINPEKEKENGFIEITDKKVGHWEVDYEANCCKCGQIFNINRNDGGHFPWFKWIKK